MDIEKELLEAIKSGRNIFLTGGAGVGKTYWQNKIVDKFGDSLLIVRTALTGLASLHVNGITIHKFSGIGINNHVDQMKFITKSRKFKTQTIYDIEDCDILFIDEISMLRSDVLGLLDALFKYVMDDDKPFGGKQVVFAGDFMQLPPVVRRDDNLPLFWAFQSPIWKLLDFKIINLTEVKRQTDKDFSNCLNWIRAGRQAMNPQLQAKVSSYIYNTRNNVMPEGVEPIKLVSTNDESNRWNLKQLRNVDSAMEIYGAKVAGLNEKLIEAIKKDCPALETLNIKIGSQIMTLKNDFNGEYINGSMGEYLGLENHDVMIGFEKDGSEIIENAPCMKIRIFNDDRIVYVPTHTWKNEKRKVSDKNGELIIETLAEFEQYPVKLAYAITIHKSQGMSLDYLEVDFRNVFMDGQAYVALSRARNYQGLIAKNWSISKIRTNAAAYNFYMGLMK